MAAIATSAPPKLPVWQTVRASYAIVARNLGQLVRICWLWVLIMAPVYAALDNWSGESGAQTAYHRMRELAAALPSAVVDLPFLASIAVAWHRLVLREERVTKPAYLRLDGTVWRYVLYAFAFLLLEHGTLVFCAYLAQNLAIEADFFARLLIELLTAPTAAMAIGLLVLPRLSLVMPAVALRERLSLRLAWRITRGNTLRLALAACACALPQVSLSGSSRVARRQLVVDLRNQGWQPFRGPHRFAQALDRACARAVKPPGQHGAK